MLAVSNLFSTWFSNGLNQVEDNAQYDKTLLWLLFGLATTGFIMIASASISVSLESLFFVKRTAAYFLISFVIGLIVLYLPMRFWGENSTFLLLATILLLVAVLIVGSNVNGASRWINFGVINIQPAEITKLVLLIYLSNFLVKRTEEIRSNFWGFCKPIAIMLVLAMLLLAQPDLGTVVVLFMTTLGLLFVAGAKPSQFLTLIGAGLASIAVLIKIEPYRLRRVTSFWDPWGDPYGSGYQLAQSLIGFGRGGWWGEGLGNSIQKQQFLPEAHTDFIFSVTGEELGYIGSILILVMVFSVAFRAIYIGYKALTQDNRFFGFLACSIGLWFSFQTLVNVGAASGILPTKGLTFPFLSYGGSSMIVMTIAATLLLRIDYELRQASRQAYRREQE